MKINKTKMKGGISLKISKTKKTKAYIPKTDYEKEQVKIKAFLDMCAPSAL